MSLRKRLQAGLALAMTLVMGLLVIAAGETVRHVGEDLVASRLRHDADSVLSALQVDAQGAVTVDTRRVGAIYERPYTGHYYVVAVAEGGATLRSRSLWDAPLAVPSLPPGTTQRWHASGPERQPLLAWAGGYRKQGRDVTIAVAEDLSALHTHLNRVRWLLGGIGLVVLLGVVALQRMILRRGFDTLQQTAADVERLGTGEISQLGEGVPDEVKPLVTEVNHLLTLLDRRLQRSRNAAGNLAHAVKSPLTLLSQLASSAELADHPQIATELNTRIDQIRHAVDSELRRARLAGRTGTAQAFRPAEDLPELVEVLRRVHGGRELEITLHCPREVVLPLDRDDALELIGNLLDNACKWARRRVRLTVDQPQAGCICVEDDGPGCSPQQIDTLLRRGTRLDESVSGHGLGLAIVQEIAELYSARLEFRSAPELGGLQVSVCFHARR